VFEIERSSGASTGVAQTSAVTMLALGQLAFLFSCRFLHASSLTPRVLQGNPVVWLAIGALIVLQLVFTYAPFMHAWFKSAPIGWRDWGLSILLAIGVFLLAEAGKAVGRLRRPTRAPARGARQAA